MPNHWPLTAREAADLLLLSPLEVTTLVRGLGLKVGWHNRAMMIDEPEFDRLREASLPIVAARRVRRPSDRRRKPVAT